MVSTYDIVLDVHKTGPQTTINAKKGEYNSRLINISFTQDGTPVSFETGTSARFYARKPDGESIYQDCNITNNMVSIIPLSQTFVVEGFVFAEIEIIQYDIILFSPTFIIEVEDSICDGSAVESTSVWPILQEEVAKALKWNLLGSVVGSTEITLPSKWNELAIYLQYGTTTTDLLFIIPNTGYSRVYRTVLGYYAANNDYKVGTVEVNPETNKIKLILYKIGINDSTSGTNVDVYYR